jgi:hypothetical protein
MHAPYTSGGQYCSPDEQVLPKRNGGPDRRPGDSEGDDASVTGASKI